MNSRAATAHACTMTLRDRRMPEIGMLKSRAIIRVLPSIPSFYGQGGHDVCHSGVSPGIRAGMQNNTARARAGAVRQADMEAARQVDVAWTARPACGDDSRVHHWLGDARRL